MKLMPLQGDPGSFSQDLPAIGSRYRTLNLITAGFTLFNSLTLQARKMRTALNNLKHAKDMLSASSALQQMANALNASQQAVTTGLPTPGAWYASGGGGFVQDVDTVPGGGSGTAQPFAASPAMSASPVNSAMPASAPANSPDQPANAPADAQQKQQTPNQQQAPADNSGNAQQDKNKAKVGDAINKTKQKLKLPF